MKNKIKNVNILICLLFLSFNAQSQNISSNNESIKYAIPSDLSLVFHEMPENCDEIDNIHIRFLRAKVDPKNATECLAALPDFIMSDSFLNVSLVKKSNFISYFMRIFEKIFTPVNKELYIKVCNELKKNEDNHRYIYYIVNSLLKTISNSDSKKYIQGIIEFLPLRAGKNELIISSFFDNLDEKTCLSIISTLENKNADNAPFVKEINEAKQQILYNKMHPQNNNGEIVK